MDAIEFVNETADLLESYAKKHNFNKKVGYEILVKQTDFRVERLDDTLWVSNPNGKNASEVYTRKIELLALKDAKKTTLNSKIAFLEKFLLTASKNKSDIAILPFEQTRRQRKQQEFSVLLESLKSLF